MFLAIPLFMYGLIVTKSIIYFLTMILVLIIFPIFLVTIISLIMLFVMQLTKFIKNKDIFQIIIILLLTILISFAESYLLKEIFDDNLIQIEKTENNEIINAQLNNEIINNKLDKLNNYFIIINPCISLLTNLKIINIICQLIKLIFICLITFLIFIYFGKLLYLKNLLKNIAYINKNKNTKKILKNKYNAKSIKKSYIKNEFKKLIKNSTFFIQCIFQYIFIVTILLSIVNLFMPMILQSFEEQNAINELGIDKFAIQSICMIIGMLQIMFTLCNLSLTAISREGKNAMVMKYIPVSLYKQFMWKNKPQIFINTIVIIATAIVIWKNIPQISIWYYIAGSAIAMVINIINSFLMLIVDLKKPYLDWTTEVSALKDNGNKLYQYVTTIITIVLLTYLADVFEEINIIISLLSIFLISLIILVIINKYIKKNINKIFEKIY